jgi:hypothetical protein
MSIFRLNTNIEELKELDSVKRELKITIISTGTKLSSDNQLLSDVLLMSNGDSENMLVLKDLPQSICDILQSNHESKQCFLDTLSILREFIEKKRETNKLRRLLEHDVLD